MMTIKWYDNNNNLKSLKNNCKNHSELNFDLKIKKMKKKKMNN
jgi:hypothetical protein